MRVRMYPYRRFHYGSIAAPSGVRYDLILPHMAGRSGDSVCPGWIVTLLWARCGASPATIAAMCCCVVCAACAAPFSTNAGQTSARGWMMRSARS
jgi:hypothetical protein